MEGHEGLDEEVNEWRNRERERRNREKVEQKKGGMERGGNGDGEVMEDSRGEGEKDDKRSVSFDKICYYTLMM